jgi:hypothetical protein
MTTEGVTPTTGLRPLSVGETLDRAINVYRRNAATLWKIIAVVVIPIQVLQILLQRVAVGHVVNINGTFYKVGGGSSGGAIVLVIVLILSIAAVLIANGATFKAIGDAYLGHEPDWAASLSYARSRLGALLVLAIVATILIAIGFLLFVLPGIYLMVCWSVAIAALMLEGKRGFASLGRSFELVRGRWWATFGRLLAALVVYAIAYFVIALIAGAIANGISNYTVFLIVAGIFNAATNILFIPFIAAVLVVIYIDLRVRKEALDIEMLAASLGSPAPTAPASPVGSTAPTGFGGPAAGETPPSQPPPN